MLFGETNSKLIFILEIAILFPLTRLTFCRFTSTESSVPMSSRVWHRLSACASEVSVLHRP
jgi:hypothetical protein